MQLRARTWLRICFYGQLLIAPLVVVVCLSAFGVVHIGWAIASFVILLGFGVSGAILRLLNMTGRVALVFTQQDLECWVLRFWYKIETRMLSDFVRSTVILKDDDTKHSHT